MERPSYDLIVAAVGGDEKAMEEILQHYEPMINEQCGGDEDMKQELSLKLWIAFRTPSAHLQIRPSQVLLVEIG